MPPFTPTLMSMEFTGFFRYKAIIKQRARRNKANHALMKAQKMTLKKELIKTFRNMEGSTPASEKVGPPCSLIPHHEDEDLNMPK